MHTNVSRYLWRPLVSTTIAAALLGYPQVAGAADVLCDTSFQDCRKPLLDLIAAPNPAEARGDVRLLARSLGMPLVEDAATGTWCLGRESGGRALASASAPPLVLPDQRGDQFELASLLGQKVLLIAWASW